MTTLLREWARTMASVLAPLGGLVSVREPASPNGALSVDVDCERFLAQVLLWPNGMLETNLVTDARDGVVTESHEVRDDRELLAILQRVASLHRSQPLTTSANTSSQSTASGS